MRNSQVEREMQALWALAHQKIAFAKTLEGPLAIRVHNPLAHCLMFEAGQLIAKANALDNPNA